MKRTLTAFTWALLAVSAAQATPTLPTHEAVRYDDLDLTSEADIARLGHRIEWAAQVTCRTYADRQMGNVARLAECRKAAVADAWAHIRLTAR